MRQALEAGHLDTTGHPVDAKDYGPFLTSKGFQAVPSDGYSAQKGDVVVIQPYAGGNPSGHTAMYDGTQWVSDFRQKDFWGGPKYRQYQPGHIFYRLESAPSNPSGQTSVPAVIPTSAAPSAPGDDSD